MTEQTNRDEITTQMRDNARRIARASVVIKLQATKGKHITSEVVQFYTRMNVAAMVAELCDEILRLRKVLHEIADDDDNDNVELASRTLNGPIEAAP